MLGHTHVEGHRDLDGVEVLNPGTWSAAYEDPECRHPTGRQCFVWIDRERVAHLMAWDDPGWTRLGRA